MVVVGHSGRADVREGSPTTNFNNQGVVLFSGGYEYQAWARFDTSSISLSGNSYILRWYYNAQSGSGDIIIERSATDFTPSTITWNNQPTPTGTNAVTFTPTGGAGAWQEVDITTLFKDGDGSFFAIRFRNSGGTGAYAQITSYRIAYDRFYIRTSGNDSNSGYTWGTPWKTIDKAANTLTDGQEVLIEGGTYNAEPASNDIAPVNAGTTGIKYTVWGTAGSGTADGTGTGTVTIEKNA